MNSGKELFCQLEHDMLESFIMTANLSVSFTHWLYSNTILAIIIYCIF
jgi:hypothetical protein